MNKLLEIYSMLLLYDQFHVFVTILCSVVQYMELMMPSEKVSQGSVCGFKSLQFLQQQLLLTSQE